MQNQSFNFQFRRQSMKFIYGVIFLQASLVAQQIIIEDSLYVNHLGYHHYDHFLNGEDAVVQSLIPDSGIVFDVGANRGTWLHLMRQYHENVIVHAFEPVPCLCKEYLEQYQSTTISIHEKALSNFCGLGKLYYYSHADGLGGLVFHPWIETEVGKPQELIVELDTVDAFCEQNSIDQIDFMKIDVEGAELAVIEGAQRMIAEHRIRKLQFEYNNTFKDAGITLRQIYEHLTSQGYALYRVSPDYLIHIPVWHNDLENYYLSNYLAVAID